MQLVSLVDTHGATTPASRRYELDWLRVFVVLGVVLYHVAGFFAAGTTLDPLDAKIPLALEVPNLYFNAWAMPLLFAIAGAASCFALRRRGPRAYLGSRVARLVVPFLFGTLVLVPLQVYGVLLSDPGLLRLSQVPVSDPHPLDSYPHFYTQYLHGYWYFLGHYSSQLEFVFWGHLWFISRLIACMVATLPLLLLLNTRPGKRVTGLIVRGLQWPPAMLLPGLAIGGAVALFHQAWAVPHLGSWSTLDWAQFAVLLLCYLMGYVLYADYRGVMAIERSGPLALLLGIGTFGLFVALSLGAVPGAPGAVLLHLTEGVTDWLWVLAFLSLGCRYLARSKPMLPYLNEASYAFYVLHIPVLVAVAALVVPLPVPAPAKLALLLAGTLLLLLALYGLLIRRFALTRFLLGVRLAPTGRDEDSLAS